MGCILGVKSLPFSYPQASTEGRGGSGRSGQRLRCYRTVLNITTRYRGVPGHVLAVATGRETLGTKECRVLMREGDALRPELPSHISITLERSSYDTRACQNITNPYIAITPISQHRLTSLASYTINTHVRGSSISSGRIWSQCPRTERTGSCTWACHTEPLATTANPSCCERSDSPCNRNL